MAPNQAAEHLQAIRTLMERSAVYRRALAPIMVYCGVVGIIGGVVGGWWQQNSARGFVVFWASVAGVALLGSFLMVRRQSFKDGEPFWSPPIRRVVEALIPPFAVGAFLGVLFACANHDVDGCGVLVPVWCVFFGLGIYSAGFFMPRGLKLFGLFYILTGILLIWGLLTQTVRFPTMAFPNSLMAATFGGFHLAYGIYLYFTEPRGKTL